MKFGVIVFSGSNCDADCFHVIRNVFHKPVRYIWHKDTDISGLDCIILPGGFSYGDYLRCGAIARFSPVMSVIDRFAKDGGLVLGICNGFQILCESGLLPGALMRNRAQHFICKYVNIRVENTDTPFSNKCGTSQVLKIPIAHGEGNYFADENTISRLKENNQIIFRYCEEDSSITDEANPNGSMENIAGICNEERNVLGMMPHPERCSESILGSSDGKFIFESIQREIKDD